MNCADVKPNLEAYALDGLDSLTRARVERHLERCATCRGTVAELRNAAGELPYALGQASPLRPPAALKMQVMQAAQADAQARAIRQTFGPRGAPPVPIGRRGHWLLNPRMWMISLGAAMVAIVLLAASFLTTNRNMQEALSNEQAARQQITALQAQQELAVPVLNSLTTQEIVLRPTDAASRAYGKVLVEPNKPTVVFVAYNLPAPASGEKYVIWTTTKGLTQAEGYFAPNANGFAMVVFQADRSDPILKEVLVTRQPVSKIYPSSERVLVWRADPSDAADEITYGSLFPQPTVITPSR